MPSSAPHGETSSGLWDAPSDSAPTLQEDSIFAVRAAATDRERGDRLSPPPGSRRAASRRPGRRAPRWRAWSAVVSLIFTAAMLGAIVLMADDRERPAAGRPGPHHRPDGPKSGKGNERRPRAASAERAARRRQSLDTSGRTIARPTVRRAPPAISSLPPAVPFVPAPVRPPSIARPLAPEFL